MWLIKYYLVLLMHCLTVKLNIMKKCGNCGRHFEGQAFNEFTISGPYYCSYKCHCEAELIINKYEEEKRKKYESKRKPGEFDFFGKIAMFITKVILFIILLFGLIEFLKTT